MQNKLISRLRCIRVIVFTWKRPEFLSAETMSFCYTEAFVRVQKITIILLKLIVKSCVLPFLVCFKKVSNTKWRHLKQPVWSFLHCYHIFVRNTTNFLPLNSVFIRALITIYTNIYAAYTLRIRYFIIYIIILNDIFSFINTQMHQYTLQLTLEIDLPVKCHTIIYS